MNNHLLPEFQEFLRLRRFVNEKYIPFYAHWASKFLIFSNTNEALSHDLKIKKFLNYLDIQGNIADWQVNQADKAIHIYVHNFLNKDKAPLHPNNLTADIQALDIPKIFIDMRKAIRIKHYAYSTERTYLDWVKRFFNYLHNTKRKDVLLNDISSASVKDYLTYLAVNKRVTASTQNQAFNALIFLFREVLQIDIGDLSKTVRAKRGQRLPVVLSVEEVKDVFKYIHGVNGLILQLLYGAGLRLMEALRLRVKDIDFSTNLLFIRDGKGGKDRTTVLPESIKKDLKLHLKKINILHKEDIERGYGEVYLPYALERKYPNAAKEWHWQYTFPSSKLSAEPRTGVIRRHHIHEKTIQSSLKAAVRKAGIAKHVSVHTLRHSFATHLLMSGVNIREIQQLLGHKNIETTMIYTHVLRDTSKVPESPLDTLNKS